MYESSQAIKVERASPPALSCHVTENVYANYNMLPQARSLSTASYFPSQTGEYVNRSVTTPQYSGLTELPAFASVKENDSNWTSSINSNSCQNFNSLTGRRYSDAMTCQLYCCQDTSVSTCQPHCQNNRCVSNPPPPPPYPTGQSFQYYNQYHCMSPPVSPQTSPQVLSHQDSLSYFNSHANPALPLPVEFNQLQHSSMLLDQHQTLMHSPPNNQNPVSTVTPPNSPLLTPLQSPALRSDCHSSMLMQNVAVNCNATAAFHSENSTLQIGRAHV